MNKKAFTAFVLCLFFTSFGLFFISLQGIRHAAGAPDLFLRCAWAHSVPQAQSVPRRHGCAFLGEYCAMRFPLVEWSIYGINRVYPNDTEKITRKAFHTGYKKNYETYHNYDTPY